MFSKFVLYMVAHVILPNAFAMAAEAYALVVVMAVVVKTVVSVAVDVVATVVVVLPDDGSGQLQREVEEDVEVEVDVVVSLSLSTKQCAGSRAKQVGKSVPWSHHSGNPADWSENDLKHRFISAPRVSSIAFLHSSCVAGMR